MSELRMRGFTLLETLLVLTLVGILASLAYPSYARHLQRGERQTIQTALQEQLLQQEQYRAQHQHYAAFEAGAPGDLPFRADTGRGDARYLLGARACKNDSGEDLPLSECIDAFAEPASTTAPSPASRTAFAINSYGQRSCPDNNTPHSCRD